MSERGTISAQPSTAGRLPFAFCDFSLCVFQERRLTVVRRLKEGIYDFYFFYFAFAFFLVLREIVNVYI